MDKNSLLQYIKGEHVKDYTYIVVFFLIFSFFTYFAIRPNLITAFSLQKELDGLNKLDQNYEDVILHIVDLQSSLERYRDNLYLLDQSIPSTPQVNKIIDDLTQVASSSGLVMKKVDINQINLKEDANKKNLKSYVISIESDSQFPNVYQFVNNLMVQRRLKTIKSLDISRGDTQGTASASLLIKLEVNGFYL